MKKSKCSCANEIAEIVKDYIQTLDNDKDMQFSFAIGIAMGDSSMIDKANTRITKAHLFQPLVKWLNERGINYESLKQ